MVSISLEQLCELRPEGQLVKVGVPVQFWCCGVWLVVLFKNDETIYNCNVNAMKKKTVFSTTLHISFKRCWMKSADPIYQHPASHSCSRQSASASWLGSDSTRQLSSLFLWLWHSCWQWAQWTSCWKLSYLSTANKGCCSVVANEHHLSAFFPREASFSTDGKHRRSLRVVPQARAFCSSRWSKRAADV